MRNVERAGSEDVRIALWVRWLTRAKILSAHSTGFNLRGTYVSEIIEDSIETKDYEAVNQISH